MRLLPAFHIKKNDVVRQMCAKRKERVLLPARKVRKTAGF